MRLAAESKKPDHRPVNASQHHGLWVAASESRLAFNSLCPRFTELPARTVVKIQLILDLQNPAIMLAGVGFKKGSAHSRPMRRLLTPTFTLWLERSRDTLEPLLPALCLSCQTRCFHPAWLCMACLQQIRTNRVSCKRCAHPLRSSNARPMRHLSGCPRCHSQPLSLNKAVAPLVFDGPVRKLIHAWKFRGQTELTPLLVQLALDHGVPPPSDYWLPIPMHWRKNLQRGFNQTLLLAGELSRQLPITQRSPIRMPLKVSGQLVKQHSLNRAERVRLAEHRFVLRHKSSLLNRFFTGTGSAPDSQPLAGHSITLIDDVMTTGATLEAAASVLKAAGARSVNAWCLAHTP